MLVYTCPCQKRGEYNDISGDYTIYTISILTVLLEYLTLDSLITEDISHLVIH